MRIVIDVKETHDAAGRKAVGVRTWWMKGKHDEPLRVQNCGIEIYEILKDGFSAGFVGGVIEHEGERR